MPADPKPRSRQRDRERKRLWKQRNRERVAEQAREYKQRLAAEGVVVVCPDCGQERRLSFAPKGKRCPACAIARKRTGRTPNRTCEQCGRRFYRRPAADARFCSVACRKAAGGYTPSGSRLGQANPNWRHGDREGEHRQGFTLARKGEKACRNCGSTWMLHLHHIVPRGKWPGEAREDLRNGMTLCTNCHLGWHRRRVTLPLGLLSAAEYDYIVANAEIGENAAEWLNRYYEGEA